MFQIVIERNAEKDLQRLSDEVHDRIPKSISSLADSPRPAGANYFLTVVIVAVAALLPTATATAGSMESVALYDQYKALSNDPRYKWAGAVTMNHWNGNTYTASCVAVAPTLVIGAGHFTPGPTSTSVITTVIFGPNYKTGARLVMEVERWEQFPGYVFGDKTTADLGMYHLKQPIPGFAPVAFVPDTPALGTVLTMVDYGNYGDTTTGELPSLGDRLAGRAQLNAYPGGPDLAAYPLTKYAPLYFHRKTGQSYLLPTQGLPYSSGSPWFDESGKLAFITIAGINGTIDHFTISLRLSLPEVQAWLQPKIAASWAAHPPQLSMTMVPGAARLTWDGAATGWRLQATRDFTGWTDPGSLLTGPGNYEDPLADPPRRFYRLGRP